MVNLTTPRPFIFVLAGVNGAGKSSVGGNLLTSHGLVWYNPDAYSRELVSILGLTLEEANSRAWEYGSTMLEAAIYNGTNFAFETTLGANTIPNMLLKATNTHDVVMLYCGLSSPEQHISRVQLRVANGGHDIPEQKIRERWASSRTNLVKLLPYLANLQVFDNSLEAIPGEDIPEPHLLLEMKNGQILYPEIHDAGALASTPDWAKAIIQAAIEG